MSRPIWFVNFLKKVFPQRFLLARLTRQPLLGKVVDYGFFNGDELVYLPSDRSINNHHIPIHENLNPLPDVVLPSQVLEHFIENASHHWLMDFCICRESNQCADYPRQYGCLFLGEAVKKINPRLGRLVSKEQALEHAHRCQEAGLVHLVGRNKLDTIWLGAGPGERLLTICHCCPCCCLWKALPELTPLIGNKITPMPGVSVQVSELCMGCGTCTEGVCFVDAIQLVDGQAQIGTGCRGCGRCVETCPNGAIELIIQDGAYIDKTIRRISQKVYLH